MPNTDGEHLIDLEIRIFQLGDEGYPVEITLDEQQEFPRGMLTDDAASWTSSGDPVADGQQLFDMLFADGALRDAWAEARGQAPQRRIRLRIDPAAAKLHALPWELLQENNVLLSANAATPLSRYLPIALPWSGEVEERPIRILVAISNPDDLESKYNLAPLDVELEQEILEEALSELDPDEVEITFLDSPVTLERIEEALREGYHVLHYLGHGAFSKRRGQAALYLQGDTGNTQIMTDDALIGMLARQKERPRLVFLAACQSAVRSTADAFAGLGPKLVAAGVPAVVAMQDFVAVETARKLSTTFYQRLTEHGMIDLAINEARSTLVTAGRPDAAVPVLFMRLKSGQVWSDESNEGGAVLGAKPRIFWSGLIKMVKQGKCTPIIGPRVHGKWLPTPEEIAQAWSIDHGYPFNDTHELARVARYMASLQGEDFPRYELLDTLMYELTERMPEGLRPEEEFETLSEMIEAVGWQDLTAENPNEPHRVLANLNLPLYLTTNPDNFMTEALVAAGKDPAREICPWNEMLDGLPSLFEDDPDYEPTPEEPLIYHLFGSDEEVDSLLVSEDDYLDFLVRTSGEMDRIPDYIWASLTNSSLMFVGYSLDDWEFRVIMRGLVATRERRRKLKHVGVQLELDEANEADVAAVQTFLQSYFQEADINVFWGSTAQFMAELRTQWEAPPERESRSRASRRRR
ncbi:MAG: CHAT domain-containing protein [Chloroflexi bacterium]|nr:CHAT domain-containing protein [Chloroflexota bacterium]